MAGADDLGVGAHRGVDRVDAAVDQRVGARAGGVGDLERLEVGRRGGRGPGGLEQREVVLLVRARPRGAEEEREAVGDVVGRDEDVGEDLLEPGVAEILLERGVEALVVVLLLDQAAERRHPVDERAVEDLRALGDVDVGELFGGVERAPIVTAAGQPTGEDPAGRGAGDEVEHVGDPAAGAALDLGQHERGDQAPDAATVDREHLHPRAKTREPPDLRPTGFRHAARTMTHLPKKLLLIGTVACALGAAQPAAAQVQPAGTGEPLYTNSQQNTQWFEWPATQRDRRVPRALRLLREQRARRQPDAEPGPERGDATCGPTGPASRNLQHGGQYGVCAQGQYTFPNDSLWISDGPNSCSMGTQLGRRAYTTIDRSKPTTAIAVAGGAAATKDAKVPIQVNFADDVAGPFPANFMCFQFGGTNNICDANAGFIYGYNVRVLGARAAAASRRRSPARPTSARATTRRPTAPVWACVIAADAAIPDNPNGPNQSALGRAGQPVRREVRRRAARPHGSAGLDPVRGGRQGRRPRLVRLAGHRTPRPAWPAASSGPSVTTPAAPRASRSATRSRRPAPTR